uniref:Uncharacterized protein n=1 Tax=Brassica oleracea TaxID=3712 RepID=A0A3P6H7T7_BRAOL|nr:unnamed protein product [Brassica oleracea]
MSILDKRKKRYHARIQKRLVCHWGIVILSWNSRENTVV